jgi:hypothetical protein
LDEPQQVGFRNLIFQTEVTEVVEQRFGAVVLPHHDQQASDDRNQTEHGGCLSSNMLLLNLILLIDVTLSTPTGDYTSDDDHADSCSPLLRPAQAFPASQTSFHFSSTSRQNVFVGRELKVGQANKYFWLKIRGSKSSLFARGE